MANCPNCGTEFCYNSGFSIRCCNKNCQFFDLRQLNLWHKECDRLDKLEKEESPPAEEAVEEDDNERKDIGPGRGWRLGWPRPIGRQIRQSGSTQRSGSNQSSGGGSNTKLSDEEEQEVMDSFKGILHYLAECESNLDNLNPDDSSEEADV